MKRNTIQRALVLEAVNKLKCHATAEEVYNMVVLEYPNISKVTVYRNLNQLAENGEIRKLEVPGGADRFDHICRNHYHIRCLKCGRVFDVDMEYMEGLESRIKDTHGFSFSGHNLMFEGICPECRK
ncbi:MAG: Fur family transcriptional regulator [Oscillospiraceae bacterium]